MLYLLLALCKRLSRGRMHRALIRISFPTTHRGVDIPRIKFEGIRPTPGVFGGDYGRATAGTGIQNNALVM